MMTTMPKATHSFIGELPSGTFERYRIAVICFPLTFVNT
jgi:hypothetical protein